MTAVTVWRHPRPSGVAGRCIGRTDVPVDRRKAKRLAHRIRAWARRARLPRVVFTSPLRRTADVGRCLAAWGWVHRVDARLVELDFGAWDGAPWMQVGAAAMDAWIADFTAHRPGGGESVAALLVRCNDFIGDAPPDGQQRIIVGHAGWISAGLWLRGARQGEEPVAAAWPAAVGYGQRVELG